jgi:quercetin dioxygenase-like cupin family protein
MKIKSALFFAVTIATVLSASWTVAHEATDSEETVSLLQRQSLSDIPGKQVILAEVSYKPGQASTPHRHAGSVFAYVIEGEIVSQLAGQPPVTYKVGQSWYEPPRVPHLVSKNASNKRPAKLLAWLVLDEGAPPKEPLAKVTPIN